MDDEAQGEHGVDNASWALSRIRGIIDAGALGEDGKLPTERDLCARLGVSRRALRRALDALEAEGLIWRRQGKGTFVGAAPNRAGALALEIGTDIDPLSVMEARLCIEPELAALCARRATPDEVARLRAMAQRTAQSRDPESAELWDGSLHRLIARIAGNPILTTAFALLDEVRSNQRWQRERQLARSSDLVSLYDSQHGLILDAIDRRDAAGAREAMRRHLQALEQNLRDSRARAEP